MADYPGDGAAGNRSVSREDAGAWGFTLLEMLGVLALLAIFAVTLAGGLRFGGQAEQHVGSRALSNDAMWRAERFLRERLSVAQPIWVRGQPRGHVAFTGGPGDMVFFAPTPQSYGGVGFSRYVLRVETVGDVSRLLVSVATARPGEAEPELLGAAELVNGTLSIHFAYYGSLLGGGQFGWQPDWIDRTVMPQLISIRAQPKGADPTAVLDVTLRPRVDIDVPCQLNVQTVSCLGH